MNPGTLKSQVFDVDVTIRADTTSGAPVVEISDMGHQPMRPPMALLLITILCRISTPTMQASVSLCGI